MTDDVEIKTEAALVDGIKPFIERASKPARACSACEWSAIEKPDRVCRLGPPHVTFLATPGMVMTPNGPRPGMEVKPWCAFPIVRDDAWCSHFRSKAAATMVRAPRQAVEQNDG